MSTIGNKIYVCGLKRMAYTLSFPFFQEKPSKKKCHYTGKEKCIEELVLCQMSFLFWKPELMYDQGMSCSMKHFEKW